METGDTGKGLFLLIRRLFDYWTNDDSRGPKKLKPLGGSMARLASPAFFILVSFSTCLLTLPSSRHPTWTRNLFSLSLARHKRKKKPKSEMANVKNSSSSSSRGSLESVDVDSRIVCLTNGPCLNCGQKLLPGPSKMQWLVLSYRSSLFPFLFYIVPATSISLMFFSSSFWSSPVHYVVLVRPNPTRK